MKNNVYISSIKIKIMIEALLEVLSMFSVMLVLALLMLVTGVVINLVETKNINKKTKQKQSINQFKKIIQ